MIRGLTHIPQSKNKIFDQDRTKIQFNDSNYLQIILDSHVYNNWIMSQMPHIRSESYLNKN